MSSRTTRPLSHDKILSILHELDRILAQHQQWLGDVFRALICQVDDNTDSVIPDDHQLSAFGQWYYGLSKALLHSEDDLARLGDTHRQMHEYARKLLHLRSTGQAISTAEYEAFMAHANEFRQKMRAYQLALVQRICSVDHLTGVWNRNSMLSRLEAEAERARRGHKDFAICLFDLDHFKLVNDRFGHLVGDEVLHAVAQFMRTNLRAYDTLFRYGGEEFLICLPDTDSAQAERLLNRIREKLATTALCHGAHADLRISASFGVTSLTPNGNINEAIERADHALLCAKTRGRNAVCIWDIAGAPPTDQAPA